MKLVLIFGILVLMRGARGTTYPIHWRLLLKMNTNSTGLAPRSRGSMGVMSPLNSGWITQDIHNWDPDRPLYTWCCSSDWLDGDWIGREDAAPSGSTILSGFRFLCANRFSLKGGPSLTKPIIKRQDLIYGYIEAGIHFHLAKPSFSFDFAAIFRSRAVVHMQVKAWHAFC